MTSILNKTNEDPMKPQYIGEVSKTSRTLANEDSVYMQQQRTRQSVNAVLKKPQKIHRRRKVQRIAYFQMKHRVGQRRIIQKPWSRPMAAQHLAAIKIQGSIRRFLYLKRKETGMLIPYFQQKRLQEQRKQLQQQTALIVQNMQFASPAQQMQYQQQLQQLSQINQMQQQQYRLNQHAFQQQRIQMQAQIGGQSNQRNHPNQSEQDQNAHLSATQKLRQKFLTSQFNVIHKNEDQCLRNYCAAIIQATYKMSLTRRLFKYHRFAMYHIAAIQIQWAWRGFLERKKKVELKTKDQIAAEKIQKAWRSYTNVRIYRYYKDLINFRKKGNPFELLKSINRGEACLLDAASKCHVRFRLGGLNFPPLIYYKIFSTGTVVDIGSFAPRDYNAIKKQKRKQTINIRFDKPENDAHEGWYERIENNGWRPINDKVLTPFDPVEIETANKPKPFHFDPIKRKALTEREKRLRKIRWLRKLYRDAKNAELVQEQNNDNDNIDINNKMAKELEKLYDNPFDDENLPEMRDGDFEEEVNNLIEWCEDLDYEKYTENWHDIATSTLPDLPQPAEKEAFKITGEELGGFSFQPNPIITQLQQEMGLDGQGIQLPGNQNPPQFTQAMIDQNIQMIQREQMMQQQNYLNQMQALNTQQNQAAQNDHYRMQKMKEEVLTKSNLDYENRLRGHMYQFDENEIAMQNQNAQSQLSKGVPSLASGKKIVQQNIKDINEVKNISMSRDTENMM